MREFKKRRGGKEEFMRFVVKCAGTLVLLVVTVYLMRAAWGMYVKMAEASQAQEEAEAELASAKAQQLGVSSTLSDIGTQRGEEAQIRERFGYARPGEGEIDIVVDPHATSTATTTQESWLSRLFKAFKIW
jgi:septal ring-binding cell division protein DamX